MQEVDLGTLRDTLSREDRIIITFTALGTLTVCICCGCCIHRVRQILHRTRRVVAELPASGPGFKAF